MDGLKRRIERLFGVEEPSVAPPGGPAGGPPPAGAPAAPETRG
jgi:hypothetical protein